MNHTSDMMAGKFENKILPGRWPVHGWFGIGLVLVFWTLNWTLSGLRTHWIFFPLWLGYCLTIDAIVCFRKGSSLLTRNPGAYVMLFVISMPFWWLFEFLNWRILNWYYVGKEFFSDFEYILLASLNFSTVVPAVFGTAELASTFKWLRRIRPGLRVSPTRTTLFRFFISGWIMLVLLYIWPVYFFPFLWISIYFILEPVNVWLGNHSLLKHTAIGDWRPVLTLWVGCLICGFFWEMWNFYSYPKWIYRIPFVDFLYIFEMPLLGYLGYLPFSLELFALYHLIVGMKKGRGDYVRIGPE